jgi:hypothetical protein
MFGWGSKKSSTVVTSSTEPVTIAKPSAPEQSITTLRESIENQEKR